MALVLAFEVNGEENVGSQRRLWVRDIKAKVYTFYAYARDSVQCA